MKEGLINFQTNFQIKGDKFFIAETPTGQETIFMLKKVGPKKEVKSEGIKLPRATI